MDFRLKTVGYWEPRPYCKCIAERQDLNLCHCGEELDVIEWKWQMPEDKMADEIVMTDDRKQVKFHPSHSTGTAAVRGDTPMVLNHQYYWEVKILSKTFDTNIMVGMGTSKVDLSGCLHKYFLLGEDAESYGIAYQGKVKHNATEMYSTPGFCRGTLVGVRLDMWHGTMEFYINRHGQGINFYNLRRHKALYPIVCSTDVRTSVRLTYAASWRASLLVDAAKVLAESVTKIKIPPMLEHMLKVQFWLTLPSEGCVLEKEEDKMPIFKLRMKKIPIMNSWLASDLPDDTR